MLKKFSGLDDGDGVGGVLPFSVTGSVTAWWYSRIQGGTNMKIPIVNRRQFIKTAAASTLLLSNIDLSWFNPIFSTCNADIRKNQLTGLTMQNTRPKAPLVSVYGLGYEGTRSVKSLADKVDIPDIEVEMRDGTIHEGHLNFLIMGYRYWMESNLDEMLEHYHEIGNLKIAVVGVSVNGQGMCLGNEALKKLTELTTIFDTVLLVPDLRMNKRQFHLIYIIAIQNF